MSDSHRGNFRTRGGGGRGRGDGDRDHSNRDGRGRGRGGGGNRDNRTGPGSNREGGEEKERPKRDNILDLNKYINEKMRIKFSGGREVVGLLKGFDQLMNLVLDEVEEVMRGESLPQLLSCVLGETPLADLFLLQMRRVMRVRDLSV